ncbi:MAG: hypothetical protein M0T79_03565 [Actinomycetota bacterium]|nr:hypothetical protein [Actinomycetota bacterium]
MSHRMDVELTSTRDDETFTWRVAGALQPRGVVAATLLPKGAKVGDVVRVEAEVEIDGITVVQVLPAKDKQVPSGRIEILGTRKPVAGVTTALAGPQERRRESRFFRDGDDPRQARPGGDRRPRRDGPADSRAKSPSSEGDARGGEPAARDLKDRTESDRAAPGSSSRPRPRSDRPMSKVASARRDLGARKPEIPAKPVSRGPRREDAPLPRSAGGTSSGRAVRPPRPAREAEKAGRPSRGPVRLEAGTRHRDELMARLPPEQRVIADRLAAGGLPAMRKAIADEQERALLEGRPAVAADSILALAEELQPELKAAMWMDRAEAALANLDELGLRDLRATVVAAAPRDDSGRDLERQLREGLERRVTKLRADWEEHLTQSLAEGRVLQALRLSARPPEPTARFPAALIERLVNQVGAAMSAETPPDRWIALLDAVVACPVRRQIKPAGIPEDPSGSVHRKAREAAGRVPALATMLGMAMPPPPKPLPGERVTRPHPPRAPRPLRPTRPGAGKPPTGGDAGAAASSPDKGAVLEPSAGPPQGGAP